MFEKNEDVVLPLKSFDGEKSLGTNSEQIQERVC